MDVMSAAFLASFGLILQVKSSPPYVLESDDWNFDESILPLTSIDSRSAPSRPLRTNEIEPDGLHLSNQNFASQGSSFSTRLQVVLPERCDFVYGGSCYAIIIGHNILNLKQAKETCRSVGGRLADVYSEEHFNIFRAFMRSRTPIAHEYVNVWTGMTLDTSVFLRDATLFTSEIAIVMGVDETSVTLGQAEVMCLSVGGKLADVLSEEHFHLIRAQIRSRTPIGISWTNAWTGMTVDTLNRRVKLSNGKWAPFVLWFPNRPHYPPHPFVGIRVALDNTSKDQGFVDNYDYIELGGSVCQL